MSNALVSVIVPTYNRAYCLKETIDSVLAQTYSDFEIIVIDDGSTDDTYKLFEGRYASDPRIKYFQQPNTGISGARNAGIRQAIGKYIAFCDSDDIWLPYKLEIQVACLETYPEVGLAWTDLAAVDPNGNELHKRYTRVGYSTWSQFSMEELFSQAFTLRKLNPRLPIDGKVYMGDIFTPMIVGTLINLPTVMISRKSLMLVGTFDESMKTGEDYDFNLRICCSAPVIFVDVVTIAYRMGAPDQLTRPELLVDQARNSLRTLYPVVEKYRDRIRLNDSELKRVFAERYRWLANTELDMGNHAAARAAFWKSLCRQPGQPRLVALFLATLVPPMGLSALRTIYQKLKRL